MSCRKGAWSPAWALEPGDGVGFFEKGGGGDSVPGFVKT